MHGFVFVQEASEEFHLSRAKGREVRQVCGIKGQVGEFGANARQRSERGRASSRCQSGLIEHTWEGQFPAELGRSLSHFWGLVTFSAGRGRLRYCRELEVFLFFGFFFR